MTILGIANDETASACIVRDGSLVAAASEERFTRIKMDNSWPVNAINFCLSQSRITIEEVDVIAYGWSAGFDAEKHLIPYFDRIVYESRHNPGGLDIFRERIVSEIEQDRGKRQEFWSFIEKHGLKEKVVSCDHHESHAFSAYSCSPFENTLVVTCDGRGDFLSFTVSTFTREKMEVLYRGTSVDSLGFFYGRITRLLGYTPHRHEGKVTGLAAHGNPEILLPLMKGMIDVEEGQIVGKPGENFRPFYSNFSDSLEKIIAGHSKEDVAAAAQVHLEECITKIVTHYVKKTDSEYVCMSGGVFANVRVNQCVMEIPGVKNIYIHPQMGDGGLCVGAAASVLFNKGVPKLKTENMYLGPEYSPSEIEDALKTFDDITYSFIEETGEINRLSISALKEDRVIGWFNGRMEFGPRALCNRSILYHCKDPDVNDWLNERMDRTEFMPFAPVTAEELAQKCYLSWQPDHIASRYMTVTYNCTDEMTVNCPAAVHIDGTARPQIVGKADNPVIHDLLLKYYEEEGGLALINTSFNRHEEPIVNSPSEAIQTLSDGIIDFLVIGPFIASRLSDK